jgi:hypothetical protein
MACLCRCAVIAIAHPAAINGPDRIKLHQNPWELQSGKNLIFLCVFFSE